MAKSISRKYQKILTLAHSAVIAGGVSEEERQYAVWQTSTGVTVSGGGVVATCSQSGGIAMTDIAVSSGKWYWECTMPDVFVSFGASASANENSYCYNQNVGVAFRGAFSITTYRNESGIDTTMTSYSGTTASIALNMDDLECYFYRNGVLASEATVNPVTGLTAGSYKAMVSRSGPSVGDSSYTANFGATSFAYTPPVGYNPGLYLVL